MCVYMLCECVCAGVRMQGDAVFYPSSMYTDITYNLYFIALLATLHHPTYIYMCIIQSESIGLPINKMDQATENLDRPTLNYPQLTSGRILVVWGPHNRSH